MVKMKSYIDLAEYFGIPEQRIKNLLHRAGLLCKILKPNLHWEVTDKGLEYYSDGVWKDSVIEIIEEELDSSSIEPVIDYSGVDQKYCENCIRRKPCFLFYDSNKSADGLTKWCKECLASL